MNEWLQNIAQSQELPWLSAFALGILTSISPCPLATNITATAYIAKGFSEKRMVLLSGLIYTLGRAISYVTVGMIIYFGASKFQVARFFQTKGELFLGPILIIIGLIMLGVIRLDSLGKSGFLERFTEKFKDSGLLGALFLGILFALAFCPYSGVLYFGMLIPMTISQPSGLWLPLVFAIGTGLPVILFTYLLAYSMKKVSLYFNAIQKVEKVMRYLAGSVFVLAGIYYVLIIVNAI